MYKDVVTHIQYKDGSLIQIKPMPFSQTPDDIVVLMDTMKVGEFFVCEDGGLIINSTYYFTVIRTENGLYAFNGSAIIFWPNDKSGVPDYVKWETAPEDYLYIFKSIGYKNFDLNQYEYCDLMLNAFWYQVFQQSPSNMWCDGIVSAHGDKAYQYRSNWEKAGIPFNRGVLLFLLTYTGEMDREKHHSCKFVIEKYQHYLPMIEAAEKEALFI